MTKTLCIPEMKKQETMLQGLQAEANDRELRKQLDHSLEKLQNKQTQEEDLVSSLHEKITQVQ